MSRTATDWLAENLVEVNTTTLPNGRGLGQDGMVLLYYFCDRASAKGVFFMQIRTMMDETGISMTGVKRLLAQFQEQGWITPTGKTVAYMGRGKPTPEYVLTLVPEITQKWRTGTQEGTQLGTSTEPKAKASKDVTNFLGLEPEPEPDPKPEPQPDRPRSDDLQPVRQRKEGIEVGEVLRLCIEFETAEMLTRGKEVQPGLRRKWESEYPLLIAKAIEQGHGDTPEALAWWCKDARTFERTGHTTAHKATPMKHLPAPPKGLANCFVCEGVGHGLVRDAQGVATTRKCVCAGGTWQGEERVSADQSANTHIPTPPVSADPQSVPQVVKDLRHTFTPKSPQFLD